MTGSSSVPWGLEHNVTNHSTPARPALPSITGVRNYNPVMQAVRPNPCPHTATQVLTRSRWTLDFRRDDIQFRNSSPVLRNQSRTKPCPSALDSSTTTFLATAKRRCIDSCLTKDGGYTRCFHSTWLEAGLAQTITLCTPVRALQ